MFLNGVAPFFAKMRFRSKEGIAFLPHDFSLTKFQVIFNSFSLFFTKLG
ncbi:hypothetical protein BD94_1496 [Elizabethkingia anophelis NUHP1]|uniref:Uncharacterized protein n=1 Tax=Elizabethkingia anophelis NUHP1 TaxID=1338011 RepID=A0A077ECJ5_9FLAO|nr:hypothetical protein BD94_1496 [Elizabethkingia anophelis NUHP1]